MYFFPISKPDELFYSIMARYHEMSGNIAYIHTIEDVFGSRNAVSNIEFPSMLDSIKKQLPSDNSINIDKVIEDNTLLNFYCAYKDNVITNLIKQTMISTDGKSIFLKLGLVAASVRFHKYIRYCPLCIVEDEDKYGEPYWHREHQVVGVYICSKHIVLTKNSDLQKNSSNRQKFESCRIEICNDTEEREYSNESIRHMEVYAKYVSYLVASNQTYNLKWIKNRLRILLFEKGYARLNNYIHIKRLKNDFLHYYKMEYLEVMGFSSDLNWINSIVRHNERGFDTIKYIMLLQFLEVHPQDFFHSEIDLEDIEIKEYLQQSWDDKLESLITFGYSQREICKILKTTRITLINAIERLELKVSFKSNGGGRYKFKSYTETDNFREKRNEKRSAWVNWHLENPDKSSHSIRKNYDSLYSWLQKYDKEWVEERYVKKTDIHKDRVDWVMRDEKLVLEAIKVVAELEELRNERISLGKVASLLNIKGWVSRKKHKIPMTMDYLNSKIETVDEFHKRKILQSFNDLQNQGYTNYNKVFDGANIHYRYKEMHREYGHKLISNGGYNDSIEKME